MSFSPKLAHGYARRDLELINKTSSENARRHTDILSEALCGRRAGGFSARSAQRLANRIERLHRASPGSTGSLITDHGATLDIDTGLAFDRDQSRGHHNGTPYSTDYLQIVATATRVSKGGKTFRHVNWPAPGSLTRHAVDRYIQRHLRDRCAPQPLCALARAAAEGAALHLRGIACGAIETTGTVAHPIPGGVLLGVPFVARDFVNRLTLNGIDRQRRSHSHDSFATIRWLTFINDNLMTSEQAEITADLRQAHADSGGLGFDNRILFTCPDGEMIGAQNVRRARAAADVYLDIVRRYDWDQLFVAKDPWWEGLFTRMRMEITDHARRAVQSPSDLPDMEVVLTQPASPPHTANRLPHLDARPEPAWPEPAGRGASLASTAILRTPA